MAVLTKPVSRTSSWLTSTTTIKFTCNLVELERIYSTWTVHSRSVFSRRMEYRLVALTLNLHVSDWVNAITQIVFLINSTNCFILTNQIATSLELTQHHLFINLHHTMPIYFLFLVNPNKLLNNFNLVLSIYL